MEHRSEPLTPTLNRVRRLLTVAPGAVLCREDDPPGQAYLVVSDSLRVYRRDRKNPQQNEELAELGPGAIAGELSAVLNQPRTATLQAATRTEVLPLPVEQLREMAQTHSSLLRVLIHALQDRAGLSAADISNLATTRGVDLSNAQHFLASDGSVSDEGTHGLPRPPHDATLIEARLATCPACGTDFSALVFRPHMMRPTETETDFHQHFSTSANPYDYELWVCPNDLYAALPNDFADLNDEHAARLEDVVSRLLTIRWDGQLPDFTAERTLALRERALELALELYRVREAPATRLASLLHRLAWCARERGDRETEKARLREALIAYEHAYTLSTSEDPKEDLRLQYLCGELARRVDEKAAAVRWFQQLLSHPKVKEFPRWARLARQQWSLLRED